MVQVQYGLEIPPVGGATCLVEAGIYKYLLVEADIPGRHLLVKPGIYKYHAYKQVFKARIY